MAGSVPGSRTLHPWARRLAGAGSESNGQASFLIIHPGQFHTRGKTGPGGWMEDFSRVRAVMYPTSRVVRLNVEPNIPMSGGMNIIGRVLNS